MPESWSTTLFSLWIWTRLRWSLLDTTLMWGRLFHIYGNQNSDFYRIKSFSLSWTTRLRCTNFRARLTSASNGFSQVYILITCIPLIISDIRRTLSSVLTATFKRNFDVNLLMYPAKCSSLLIVMDTPVCRSL